MLAAISFADHGQLPWQKGTDMRMPLTLARCQNRKSRRWASRFLLLAVPGAALALPLAAIPVSASADTSASPRPGSIGPGLEAAPDTITATGSNNCAVAAYKAGFSYTDYLDTSKGEVRSVVVAVAVCLAESSGDPDVYLCNPSLVSGDAPISCPAGTTSVDRGLWQINSSAWSQVSNACAFNGQCSVACDFLCADRARCSLLQWPLAQPPS